MKILIGKQTETKLLPTEITEDLLKEAKAFFDFTKTLDNCAGLAYNQTGGDKRFCAIFLDDKIFMINPRIEALKGKPKLKSEGCLSFPNKSFLEERYPAVVVSYYDFLQRKNKIKTYFNYTGQVIQHEIDHLNGKSHLTEETK